MMRAAASVEPPGGNGTISVSGRDGKVCACAAVAAHTAVNSAATILLIIPSPDVRAIFLRLVYFSGTLQRLFQLLQRKVLGSRDLQDRRLAAAAEFAGVGNFCRDIG